MENKIKLFEDKQIRSAWDKKQDWYFSIVDIVSVFFNTDYQSARTYWKKLHERLRNEGFEPVTKCHQLKMIAAVCKERLNEISDPELVMHRGMSY